MDDETVITEKSTIKLPMSGWMAIVTVIAVILGCYFDLKADSRRSLEVSKEAIDLSRNTAYQQSAMSGEIKSLNDNLGWFRQQYERDMSRYIREKPDR